MQKFVKTELQQPADPFAMIQNQLAVDRDLLESLWGNYDKDHNGNLDVQECATLMKDYVNTKVRALKAAQPIMEKEIKKKMNQAPPGMDPEGAAFMQMMGGMGVAMAGAGVETAIRQCEQAAKDPGLGRKLQKVLDKNSDGKVSKQEFMGYFTRGVHEAVSGSGDGCPTM